MINIDKISNKKHYKIFKEFYRLALENNQDIIEAISISSFDKSSQEVESRFVNLKYIIDEEWIFFSNYLSPKSKQFDGHNQIAATIFWNSINVQIRMKAFIRKTNLNFSDKHFHSRDKKKNALAISSNQSNKINSYKDVK